ncbi:MAG TPA: CHAT domain-containing protein, partial [Edaphobacter sp.]|nr:CHAT domain-containing protein [Edaphobacter sp.]
MGAANLLQVADRGKGLVQVSWRQGNDVPRVYPDDLSFSDPLTEADHAELRWYLEDFLQFPYGAERDRALALEKKMAGWGEALFEQVFPKAAHDPDPRGFYQEAVREGLRSCELCISSDNDEFLNIPWELIHDPTKGRGYLAPLMSGLYRQRVTQKIEFRPDSTADGAFRILLVVARPYGERDVPLGAVARPVLEALRPLRPRIELELLRPPSFDELSRRLNGKPGHYNLVHFDGHGAFAEGGPVAMFGRMPSAGHLVFENADGSPHVVNSLDLGQALAACGVPLFVLNACQSAQEGKADPFASVASQLVATGASGVVAMSYSVYVGAASRFMERFYQQLAEHASLSEAVGAARLRLFSEPGRQSVAGEIELRDWIVPALFQQKQGLVPIPREGGGAGKGAEQPQDELLARVEQACEQGAYGFIGRDYDLLRLERALGEANSPWAVVQGIGGTGKTQLAYGFARWYAETGGCPGGVFVTSFQSKADLAQVIGSVVGYGTDFSSLPEQEQRDRLVKYLRENPCLLIWDNFEPVAGYPVGATPLASDQERDKLSRFLKSLRGGKSLVLITTRKEDEDWLGIGYRLVPINGLPYRDAWVLAEEVLKSVGKRPEDFNDDPDYAGLVKLLGGHPRSIEMVLRQLRRRSPGEIIQALQHRVDELGEQITDSSLRFVFSQLSEQARRHLPVLGLLAVRADADTLGAFVEMADDEDHAYTRIVGEALDAAGWEKVLEEAGRNGLVRSLANRIYEMHPTLPAQMRRELADRVGQERMESLDSALTGFYAQVAASLFEGARKAERNALWRVSIEESNLLRALRNAESGSRWSKAGAIVRTLDEFYETTGRIDEWRALRGELLARTGREMVREADRDLGDIWGFLLVNEANGALERGDLNTAEASYCRWLDYLLSLADPGVEPNIAVAYHQLGRVAEERQQFDRAEQWYRKAIEIQERLGLERWAASHYHQLGMVAQERQ